MILNENNGFYIGPVHYSPVFGKYYKSTPGGILEEISQDEYNKARDCGRINDYNSYNLDEEMSEIKA